jgi:hypothetical protein
MRLRDYIICLPNSIVNENINKSNIHLEGCIGVRARITNGTFKNKYYVAKCIFCNHSNIIPSEIESLKRIENLEQSCIHAIALDTRDTVILFKKGNI